jgi:hypothetical protein
MASASYQNSIDYKHEIIIKDDITTFKILDTCVDEPQTEEQKKKSLQFEEEFKNRYTDMDEDFVFTVSIGIKPPPLIPSYRPFGNRKRDNKSNWEDRKNAINRYSHFSHRNPGYGYDNDFRR